MNYGTSMLYFTLVCKLCSDKINLLIYVVEFLLNT